MIKPNALKKGDKIAIVSLSSGMLGEDFCSHQKDIGIKRLKNMGLKPIFMPNALKGIDYLRNHPEARAQDLKDAFQDSTIKGIFCAIGGEDTYRLIPYLLEDKNFIANVQRTPKLFTGFSDTVQSYFEGCEQQEIHSSPNWYAERTDFTEYSIGVDRIHYLERKGYEVLQGSESFSGPLLGGCLESLHDLLDGEQNPHQFKINETYSLYPSLEQWTGKIAFFETSEEKPTPKRLEQMLLTLKQNGLFSVINGLLIGKPQDERYYEEYKEIYKKVISDESLPILYNINFGHAYPRCALPYGVDVTVDLVSKRITFNEPYFSEEK